MAKPTGIEAEIGITLNKLTKQLATAEARMVRTANKWEKDFAKANAKAAQSMSQVDRAIGRTANRIDILAGSFAGALSVREVVRYADAWTVAGNKIAAAAEVSGRQARSLEEVNDIADSTRSGIEETADLYAKLLRATAKVAKSEEEVAKATELVNKAFKAGGAAASEQAAGILQLAQGLSSGILQGDELRSIRENAPVIAQAIADEFGVTIGALKQLGADGELTSERVFQAILKAQPKIESAFSKTNSTIAEGFTRLRNALAEYIGASDSAVGGTNKIAAALNFLADNIELVVTAGGILAGRFIGPVLLGQFAKAIPIIRNGATAMHGLQGAALASAAGMTALRGALALLGGPFGIVIAAATALPGILGSSADKAAALELQTQTGASALNSFAEASKAAADEQDRLAGNTTAATQAMLNQSRAAVQDSLREIIETRDEFINDLRGVGLFDKSDISRAIDFIQNKLDRVNRAGDENPFLEGILEGMKEIEAGRGDIVQLAKDMDAVAGAGDEVLRTVSRFDAIADIPGRTFADMEDAAEPLIELSRQLGLFQEEIKAIEAAQTEADFEAAWMDLREALLEVEEAGEVVRSKAVETTRALVDGAGDAEEKVKTLEGALVATNEELQNIATQANPFQVVEDGATNAAISVDKLNEVYGEYQRSREAGERLFRQGLDMAPGGKPKSNVDLSKISDDAQMALANLERLAGRTFNINSGYRDPAHNARVGGAKHSQHMQGNAFDIDVSALPAGSRNDLIRMGREAGFGGVGVYDNSLHFDTGPERAWGPDFTSGSIPGWATEALEVSKNAAETAKKQAEADRDATAAKQAFIDQARQQLEMEQLHLETAGLTIEQQVRLRSEQEMLNAAKEAGIDVDKELTESGKTYRQEIEEVAAALGRQAAAYEQVELSASQLKAQEQALDGLAQSISGSLANAFTDAVSGAKSFGDAMRSAISSILADLARLILQQTLYNALAKSMGITAQPAPLLGALGLGFSGGGYTGDGGKHEVAGTVHKGEYVFDKDATQRIGVGNLEALRMQSKKGFATGGFTLPTVSQPDPSRLGGGKSMDLGVEIRRALMEMPAPQINITNVMEGLESALEDWALKPRGREILNRATANERN